MTNKRPSTTINTPKYIGNELELFASATKWKQYFSESISPFIAGSVLEVGAGIGANTGFMQSAATGKFTSWFCLEPDGDLLSECKKRTENVDQYIHGTLQDCTDEFDTIIYIDVLEHIRDSKLEVELINQRLRVGGKAIILVPAYDVLFTPFDQAIGHYRRYNKTRLQEDFRGGEWQQFLLKYHDSVGLAASIANKLFLHKSSPSEQDIKLWDQKMVPLSKVLDPLLFYQFGKSLIGVFEKTRSQSFQ